jgi:hypothetical protein
MTGTSLFLELVFEDLSLRFSTEDFVLWWTAFFAFDIMNVRKNDDIFWMCQELVLQFDP